MFNAFIRPFLILLAVLSLVVCASVSRGDAHADEKEELETTIHDLTVERDQLKKELAATKIYVEQLQNKLVEAKAAGPTATSTTQPAADLQSSASGHKEWIVRIIYKTPFDTTSAESEIRTAQGLLDTISDQLHEARNHLSSLRGSSSSTTTNSRGHEYSHTYVDYDYDATKDKVDDLEQRQVSVKGRLRRAEDDLSVKKKILIIDAKLDNGTHVRITAKGVAFEAGKVMMEGEKYDVVGIVSKDSAGQRMILSTAELISQP